MDFLRDMQVLQDRLGDLARQNNEQALDLIQMRSKVNALASGGSGGGGIDVGGIIYASQADQKSSFTYGTSAHVFTPTPSQSFKPDTLYLVLSHVNVILSLPSDTDYDTEMYIQMDLQSGSSPSGVTFNRTPSLIQLDTLRFTKTTSQSASENRTYTHSFIYGYKGYTGSIPLKYSGTIKALNYGTSTSLTVSGWKWGAAQYIAVPLGTY